MDSNPVAARPNRFLDALPPAQRAQLERLASSKDFRPGDVLFQEGTEHDDVYLLLEGHVRLEMFVRDRGRMPIMTAGPGDLVGWSPLFSGHPMTATASALESVRVLAFDGQELRGLCESNHELGYHLMRQLALVLTERLLATRLQLLDLFLDQQPRPARAVDAEC
jgi:CRP-like cAMP-binding protein